MTPAALAAVPQDSLPGPVAAVAFVALLIVLWFQWATKNPPSDPPQ